MVDFIYKLLLTCLLPIGPGNIFKLMGIVKIVDCGSINTQDLI